MSEALRQAELETSKSIPLARKKEEVKKPEKKKK